MDTSAVGALPRLAAADKLWAIGARRGGYAKREGLRNAPGYPGLRLAQLHSFAAEH